MPIRHNYRQAPIGAVEYYNIYTTFSNTANAVFLFIFFLVVLRISLQTMSTKLAKDKENAADKRTTPGIKAAASLAAPMISLR